MSEELIVLNEKDLLGLIKEKYSDAYHIDLYIDYHAEGIIGNNRIIAEVNIEKEGGD